MISIKGKIFQGTMSWDRDKVFSAIEMVMDKIVEFFPNFWNFALFTVDKDPITIGEILLGFSFLIAGYIFIKFMVVIFDKKFLNRMDIEISKRYTIKVLTFYLLLSILFLFTLYLVKVPLHVFTVIGGAIALGAGFGAKNIMGNFISGIAIVIEHPIRVGDLIEFDNLIGTVDHIGFRATSIKSLDNINILIPNSSLLDQNVLNWTLSDSVIRSSVSVGVAYGSDIEKVQEILLKIAADHEKILNYNKNQKPLVLFSDFGDNSLNFILYYWVAIEYYIDLKKISSEIRFLIDKEFKEAGITIAFPQRDLHIKEPVQVRMAK